MWDFLQDNIVGFLGILLASLGLVIFAFELHYRRRVTQEAIEFQKEKLKLQKERLKADEEDRLRKQHWLETQHSTLHDMSLRLSENISARLRRDSSWAAEALERTKLGPYSDTLFGERKNHFREEKELIALKMVPLLLQRCEYLAGGSEKKVHIYLCIDSGTTLYPVFRNLGLEISRAHQRGEEWVTNESLTIVTNNLPGVETLMQHGRINPADRFSSLAVNCKVLPGSPLPIYSAITGEDTEDALMSIKEAAPDKSVFIGLVTGNWVRIRRHSPRCPVPLSRGGRHPEFKQKLIDVCDEVYVVSPLGKIFADMDESEVNRMLQLDAFYHDPSKKAYDEAKVDDKCAERVKLISTWRERNRLLDRLSDYIKGNLHTKFMDDFDSEFVEAPIGETSHIQFRFDSLPNDKYLEREIEFPHPYTRRSEFMDHFLNP